MKVRDWMTSNVETSTPDADLSCASMIMWRRDCGFVPVIDNESGKLCGVVTDRDICMAVATRHRPPEHLAVRDVMTTALHTCGPDDDVAKALGTMRRRQVRRLPVLDEEHRVVGVLAMADVIRHAARPGARSQPMITAQEVVDTLREIEKARTPAKPADVGSSVMAEVLPH